MHVNANFVSLRGAACGLQVVGAGKAEGAMDAANLLKPMLARGELHCIGGCTRGGCISVCTKCKLCYWVLSASSAAQVSAP